METLRVQLGDRGYPINIGQDILSTLPELVAGTGVEGVVALVTDTTVDSVYGATVESLLTDAGHTVVRCVMPAGESNKRLRQVETFIGEFLEGGLDRSSLVVALGGGVVGDTAGYTAAAFMRGIPFIQIPTTIVAQVDSSVGGKTGVNHELGKNIIGAFHQPEAVLIDMALLKTLPPRELRTGLAEVIKHGVIADEALFEHMESNVEAILECDLNALKIPVKRSCEIKAAIVAADETEQGIRANLNYGHTFGHGIEAVTQYNRFLHGEAIALGMCAAGVLARELGLVDQAFVDRQRSCFEAYGLPVEWSDLPVDEMLAAMKHDKKVCAGTMKFVVADQMGHVVHRTDVTEDQARSALEAIR
ncbi:MAG TPA: 3-dehydroquinate synthase [Candidatus Hydrogenedentes bacterium]|nr:3-dehydroquinate synthase [Candidatus Hydrogenedentota bacterium]